MTKITGYRTAEILHGDIVPEGARYLTTRERWTGKMWGWASNPKPLMETVHLYEVPVYESAVGKADAPTP